MSVVMNMTLKLEIPRMAFPPEQRLKTCQKIGFAHSAALVRMNSARHKFKGNGGKKASIAFFTRFSLYSAHLFVL